MKNKKKLLLELTMIDLSTKINLNELVILFIFHRFMIFAQRESI